MVPTGFRRKFSSTPIFLGTHFPYAQLDGERGFVGNSREWPAIFSENTSFPNRFYKKSLGRDSGKPGYEMTGASALPPCKPSSP